VHRIGLIGKTDVDLMCRGFHTQSITPAVPSVEAQAGPFIYGVSSSIPAFEKNAKYVSEQQVWRNSRLLAVVPLIRLARCRL
jgi:hypothetical protein